MTDRLRSDRLESDAISALRSILGIFGESWFDAQRDLRLSRWYQQTKEILDAYDAGAAPSTPRAVSDDEVSEALLRIGLRNPSESDRAAVRFQLEVDEALWHRTAVKRGLYEKTHD